MIYREQTPPGWRRVDDPEAAAPEERTVYECDDTHAWTLPEAHAIAAERAAPWVKDTLERLAYDLRSVAAVYRNGGVRDIADGYDMAALHVEEIVRGERGLP